MPNAFAFCEGSFEDLIFEDAFIPHEEGFNKAYLGISPLIIKKPSYLANKMFMYCRGIKDVIINPPITKIGDKCFLGSSIENISLPDTLKIIGNEAFFGCGRLTVISIPSSVVQIGRNCFCSSRTRNINLRKDGGFDMRYKNHTVSYNVKMNILIECEKGSYAHRYAIENEIEYILK